MCKMYDINPCINHLNLLSPPFYKRCIMSLFDRNVCGFRTDMWPFNFTHVVDIGRRIEGKRKTSSVFISLLHMKKNELSGKQS